MLEKNTVIGRISAARNKKKRAYKGLIKSVLLAIILPFAISVTASSLTDKGSSDWPAHKMLTLAAKQLKLKKIGKGRYQLLIAFKDMTQASVTGSARIHLDENWDVQQFMKLKGSKRFRELGGYNAFSIQPLAHLTINGQVQAVKIAGLFFDKQQIVADLIPFQKKGLLKLLQGSGVITVNATCMIDRVICRVGCRLVVRYKRSCVKKMQLNKKRSA